MRGGEGGSMEALLIALFALVGLTQIWMSGRQPFPEVSRQFGSAMLLVTVFFVVANQAPHPPSLFFILIAMTATGGIGVVIGVRHLAITHKDVIVAPFAGALMGVIGRRVEQFHDRFRAGHILSSHLPARGSRSLPCFQRVVDRQTISFVVTGWPAAIAAWPDRR